MGMIIHDDYYEAAMQLPAKQRAEFMLAVIRYGFEGEEPAGTPAWLPVFTVIKKRISLSVERSKAGSKGGTKRKQTASKPQANRNVANDLPTRVEVEGEVEVEIPPEDSPYALLCLDALNHVLGTTYSTLPPSAARTLARFEGVYTPEEVRAMVEYKRADWQDTRFKRNLTPNTLFSVEHFEQYMNQSKQHAKEASEYDIYD